MISAGDFKNGVTLEIEGNVCQIVEFQHVKPGKGAAFVRTKYKNIITGAVLEKSFRPTEKFPQARIDRVDMSYLYNDGDLYNFMNVDLKNVVQQNHMNLSQLITGYFTIVLMAKAIFRLEINKIISTLVIYL